ncbi:MAG: hypothetical protein WCI55_13310 [Armatimonadota bacterium]
MKIKSPAIYIIASLVIMSVNAFQEARASSATVCNQTKIGCESWNTQNKKCPDIFAHNFKRYATKSWTCPAGGGAPTGIDCPTPTVPGGEDCCIWENTIGCADITPVCPCP